MSVFLTLGPVLFADFEVPESLKGVGGEQMLKVHKLPGGTRVVDAMGRDDADPTWSGRFRGSAAETRARLLDYLRVQGQPIELAWSSFRYSVVIKKFDADYQQPYEIPYTITCLVVTDETSPLLTALLGLDTVVGTDLNNVVQISSGLNIPGTTAAVANVSSVTAGVQTYEGLSASTMTAVQGAVTTATTAVGIDIGTNNNVVASTGSVAGMTAGAAPSDLATSLTSQSDSFSNLGSLYQIQSSLQRVSANLANAGP
jgi:hypothetical protein